MQSLACKIIIAFFVVSTLPARGNTTSEPWIGTGLEEIRVTIDLEGFSLKESLELIKQKCSVTFAYNEAEVDVNIRVNARFRDMPLNRVLDKILHENNLEYQVQDKCIIILPAEKPLPPVAYGGIKGKVSDASNGETLIGATVVVLGARQGTITDKNGGFEFKNIPVGEYTLEISYVGYAKKQITGIKVTENNYAIVDIPLETGSVGIDEVKIVANIDVRTAPIINASELTLINSIRESDIMVTGISAEQISKSLDRDAGDVVKRAPGVSMLNKFVLVRGMAPRYNQIFINGMQMPSTQSYSRAFSFDLIPSGVIDAIEIYKLPAPELPGGFGGGVIKVKTRQSQAARHIQLKLSGEFDTRYSFTDLYTGSNDASDDWLGMGADDRDYLSKIKDLPDHKLYPDERAKKLKTMPLPNNLEKSGYNLNKGIGLNYYDSWLIGKVRVNNLTSLNYSYRREFFSRYRLYYSDIKQNNELQGKESSDSVSTEKIRLNALQSINVVINPNHKIAFNLLANRNAHDAAAFGQYVVEGSKSVRLSDSIPKDITLDFVYHTEDLLTGQFSGNHTFGKHFVEWNYGRSYYESFTPDLQIFDFEYLKTQQDTSVYQFRIDRKPGGRGNPRSSYRIDEKGKIGGIDYTFFLHDKSTFKAGGVYQSQYRKSISNDYYWINRHEESEVVSSVPWLTLSELLGAGVFHEDGSGLDFEKEDNDVDYYYDNTIWAAYLSWKQSFFDHKLELYGGIRYEYEFVQLYDSEKKSVNIQKSHEVVDGQTVTKIFDLEGPYLNYWLPSIYLTWNISENHKLRIGYGKTLDRPFSRERSFGEYTLPEEDLIYQGNKMLKNAELDNVDLRWEFYPSESEFIAVGLFYKYINNPIETFEWESEKSHYLYPVNFKDARLYGLETEVRKNLAFIPVRGSDRFSIIANFSYTYSKISEVLFLTKSAVWLDRGTGEHPLTGSSPYLLNTNLYYTAPKLKTQLAISYNLFGPRLVSAGEDQYGNLYEDSHGQIDFTLMQPLGKYITLKAGIQNLLKEDITGWRDKDFDGKKRVGVESSYINKTVTDIGDALRITTNQTVYLGLTMKF